MEINVDKEKKMVDIWLTKAEKNDEKLKESLKKVQRAKVPGCCLHVGRAGSV